MAAFRPLAGPKIQNPGLAPPASAWPRLRQGWTPGVEPGEDNAGKLMRRAFEPRLGAARAARRQRARPAGFRGLKARRPKTRPRMSNNRRRAARRAESRASLQAKGLGGKPEAFARAIWKIAGRSLAQEGLFKNRRLFRRRFPGDCRSQACRIRRIHIYHSGVARRPRRRAMSGHFAAGAMARRWGAAEREVETLGQADKTEGSESFPCARPVIKNAAKLARGRPEALTRA
jgi:hypothetical protein